MISNTLSSVISTSINSALEHRDFSSKLDPQQMQRTHQNHIMAMAIASLVRAPPSSTLPINGYDECGRSTSSPGSSTTLGDICSNSINGLIVSPASSHSCTRRSSSFPNRELLNKHEIMHSPNAVVSCKICHKTFANVYRLQRHMISHDESALLRKFKCTECDKAFKFKHHLKEHKRIHSGEKPFGCDNCGKRFSHSGSYSSHMTSKKCISMGLKLNNTKALLKTFNKQIVNADTGVSSSFNSKRSLPPNPVNYFSHNVSNVALTSTAENSHMMSIGSENVLYPVISKYNSFDAINAALLASLQNPFYNMALEHIHPYNIQRILELTTAENTRLQSDFDDMIEEVTEDVKDGQNTVMNLDDCEITDLKYTKFQPDSPTYCGAATSEATILSGENERKDEQKPRAKQKEFQITLTSEEKNGRDEKNNSLEILLKKGNESKIELDIFLKCNRCGKEFNRHTEFAQHEKVLCGLLNRQQYYVRKEVNDGKEIGNSSYRYSGSEEDVEDQDYKNDTESERKVRLRTAITEKQQTILKEHYAINSKPCREEFRVIASSLALDPKVVQVWFQNNRSREKKSNLLNNVINTSSIPPILTQSDLHSYNSITTMMNTTTTCEEQPLDLSVKKNSILTSNPLPFHDRHLSQSNVNEAINLSCKSSANSATFLKPHSYSRTVPETSLLSHRYPNKFSSSFTSLIRQISPYEGAASDCPTNPYVLPDVRSSIPMEYLLKIAPKECISNKLVNAKLSNTAMAGTMEMVDEYGTSLSPNGSEKRSWLDDDSRVYHEEDYNGLIYSEAGSNINGSRSKRIKIDTKTTTSAEPDCPFVCDQCDKAFSKQSSLARHKYEHSGQRPYKCQECSRAFKHKHHLTEHKRLHSGEKPFQCTKCLKRFSHSGSYSQHMNHRYSYCKPYRD